jgi:hypothetical protein
MPRAVLWIWRVCAIHYAIGSAAYLHFLLTGSYRYLTLYFLVLGTPFLLLNAAAEFYFAFECRSGFDPDEPLRMTWTFIALAALARFIAAALIFLDHWRPSSFRGSSSLVLGMTLSRSLAEIGEVTGGPLAMILLLIALSRVLSVQHRFGVLRGLSRIDVLMIGVIIAFMIGEAARIAHYLGPSSGRPSLAQAVLWLSDPLLGLLLIQAVLIRRSVNRVGVGLVSQCWGTYVIAILATLAGDASIWATGESLLSEPLVVLTWYIWFFVAAAFASAPAYQLAAMKLPILQKGRVLQR